MTPKEVLQAAFDKAVTGVLAQGNKSCVTENNCTICAYRGEGGFKCAIGQLLTDEQIQKYGIKEGATPSMFPEALITELFPGVDGELAQGFMETLQNAHDGATSFNFKREFLSRANDIANNCGLNPITEMP